MTNSRIAIFFSGGFRPFFLGAGLLAFLFVPLWLAAFLSLSDHLTFALSLDWHTHEMLFGYFGAVVAGFLLTAIPNWTGRPPLSGPPLILLFLLWLAGRLVMAMPGHALDLLIDGAFLVIMTGVALREVYKGQNWRNIPVVVFIALYALSNIAFHLERLQKIDADFAVRGGLSVLILLISLIGGRIIPIFSGNWLSQQNLPVGIKPFGLYDKLTLMVTAGTLILWTAAVYPAVTGALFVLSALLQGYRLLRWQCWTIRQNALLLALHVAYLWLPVGFLLLGADLLDVGLPFGQTEGIHALTAGLMTMMTLAVMSRAILGHTGRPLEAGKAGTIIFGLICFAALLRICAPLSGQYQPLLLAAGGLWSLGYLIFLIHFGRMMLLPRQD
ncbi:NnrS family protein [Emcibacter sp.]|uniref:NnrS family protein n=1 Tax=Emcibacter sp. TaxID=1979954 RepID=UPI002AA90314|nr:NnrS family protein [Emcibacter sp.]